jgi:hypothetical protein
LAKRVIGENIGVRGGVQEHREISVGVILELVGSRKIRTLHEKREECGTHNFTLTPRAAQLVRCD